MNEFRDTIAHLLGREFLGNSLLAWLVALAVVVAAMILALVSRKMATRRLAAAARHTRTRLDDLVVQLVARTNTPLLLVVSVYLGSLALVLADGARRALVAAVVLAVAGQALLWTNQVVTFIVNTVVQHRALVEGGEDSSLVAGAGVARFLLLATFYTFIVLFALSNIGLDITAWIAGLGIGGIAIALAMQNILSDLFSSLSIVLDKPFVIGDFIVAGDKMGTVEHIGIKSTRVRALSGEQLIFANTDLLTARIQNFKRMAERRALFVISVVYQTPLAKLDLIPDIIARAVEARDKVRLDRTHFKAFGPLALEFETVYYVLDPDFNLYMDIQQAINLEIARRFEDEGIEFAYSQTPQRPPKVS